MTAFIVLILTKKLLETGAWEKTVVFYVVSEDSVEVALSMKRFILLAKVKRIFEITPITSVYRPRGYSGGFARHIWQGKL